MMKIAFHPSYRYELPEGHRFPMLKYDLLPEQLIRENTVQESQFFEPLQLTWDEILLTHSSTYCQKLRTQSLSPKEIRQIGFPMRESLVERGRYIASGTYQCATYALSNGVACNIAGGTHHSFADRGEGFCIFNDIALAANLLLERGLVTKVLIVDLDVHQGNGSASIFEQNESVFTFSMHGQKNYPTRKETSNIDIGLPDGTEDNAYLHQLSNMLPKLIEEQNPGIIFYQSGVDVLATDQLGRLSLTLQGCAQRDRYVLSAAKQYRVPIVCTMGGGYSKSLVDIINAHANTFRMAMDVFY